MPDVRLPGCRSRPLVNYLKALGLLRVVGRQGDPEARGRWAGGVFALRSQFDLRSLEAFLLDSYEPAPVVSPWNGGSGFFPNDRQEALEAISRTTETRLQPFATAIQIARSTLADLNLQERPSGDAKIALIRALRRRLPDDAVDWIDASVPLTGGGIGYPPLLGSGGNDGRFDFANNYSHAVITTVSVEAQPDRSQGWLGAALSAEASALERDLSLAHFVRDASPTNSPAGNSDSLGNPWDLVLAVEGTLVLSAGSARKHGSGLEAGLVAPFTARATAAGFGSAVSGEDGRAELWLPLWSGWATEREVETLAREARAQVGRRRARSGLDFVRASGELGVARGIDAFERYALLQRAGQSSLAVPAGRVSVAPRPAVGAVRTLDSWLDRLLSFARGKRCPDAAGRAIRGLERSLFDLADKGTPRWALAVVEQLGAVEAALSRSARRALDAGLRPLRSVPASPWLAVADDGSAEFAVAVSLASLRDRRAGLPGLRDYLHGTSAERSGGRVYDPGAKTMIDPVGGVGRLAALHVRRQVDAERADDAGRGTPPSLGFELSLAAHPDSARLFAHGVLDDRRILRLVAGLSLLDFRGAEAPSRPRSLSALPTPAFDLLRLAWWGSPETQLRPRAGWASRLAAGSVEPLLREALLRLRLDGLPSIASPEDLAAQRLDGRRLAAALLLRPSIAERGDMARRLTLPSTLTAAPTQPEEKDDRAA